MDTNLKDEDKNEKNNNKQPNELDQDNREDLKEDKGEDMEVDRVDKNDDEKLSKNKPGSNITILIMIITLTLGSVLSYLPLRNYIFNPKNNVEKYIESNELVYELTSLTEYFYNTKIQDREWYSHRHENITSIKYHIGNADDSININNIPDFSKAKLVKEIKDGQFNLRAKIHKNGQIDVRTSLGDRFNTSLFINNLSIGDMEDHEISLSDERSRGDTVATVESEDNKAEADIIEEETIDGGKKELEEVEITYVLPKDLENYNDSFVKDMKHHYVFSKYIVLILLIGLASILLLTIVSFSLPYSYQEKGIMARIYNKMFLEVKLLIWLGFIMLAGGMFLIINPYGGWNPLDIVNIIYDANAYFYLIGIPVTLVLYGLIYLSIVYIKYIYHKGFKKGFIENSLMGRIGFALLRKLKGRLGQIMGLDVRKDPNRNVFILLAVNLSILWMTVLNGSMGFVAALIWAIFIFRYLVDYMLKLKDIHEATNQLAQGDFNIKLDEESGMLSPIVKNLNNIKEGFQLAVDKEIKSERMKSELISNVSHDLKTPLTSIITYIDLLRGEDISMEDQKKYIDILDRKSKRLNILIEDLFEASKAGSGNIDLNLEDIDIIALFRQTLGEMEEKIATSKLIMRVNMPDKKVVCNLDGRRTYRVFENIMENILKYTMENTRVYIDVLDEEDSISFVFKNISAYEMNFDALEITERFTRGDESRNTEGSGLGLSIAKSLVELQEGNMDISIDGDLFKLTLRFRK